MMSKTFDCAECGASAPYGRLSCPACGALLASVTGALRPARRVTEVETQPEPEPIAVTGSIAVAEAPGSGASNGKTRRRPVAPPDPAAAPTPPRAASAPVAAPKPAQAAAAVAPSPTPTRAAAPPATAQAATPAEPAPADSRPQTTTPPATPAPEPDVAPSLAGPRTPHYAPTPAVAARTRAAAAAAAATAPTAPAAAPTATAAAPIPALNAAEPIHAPAAAAEPVAAPAAATEPTSAPATKARTPAPPARSDAQRAAIVPLLEPSAIAALPATPWAPLVEPAPTLVGRPYERHLASESASMTAARPPSAYRPPSPAMAMAMAATAAWTNGGGHPDQSPEDLAATETPATPAKESYRWLESIPEPERFVEIAGWFVVVGATMSLLGFLLPWSRVVIGANTIGGYFDGWGLASPTHLLVFVSLLGVLALALRRGPLAPWISSGILGLAFGGLLLGLAWPYLIGPLGADVGLTMTALGAVALLIGGVVTLWATRHVAVEPVV